MSVPSTTSALRDGRRQFAAARPPGRRHVRSPSIPLTTRGLHIEALTASAAATAISLTRIPVREVTANTRLARDQARPRPVASASRRRDGSACATPTPMARSQRCRRRFFQIQAFEEAVASYTVAIDAAPADEKEVIAGLPTAGRPRGGSTTRRTRRCSANKAIFARRGARATRGAHGVRGLRNWALRARTRGLRSAGECE